MTHCHACFGKGHATIFANQSYSTDFGRTYSTPKKQIAKRECRHCKGKGSCDCEKCKQYPKK